MKKKTLRIAAAFALLLGAFGLSGCLTVSPPPPPPEEEKYEDYVAVSGAGFDAGERYKLDALDLDGRFADLTTPGSSTAEIDSVSVSNARAEKAGGGIKGVGEAMNAHLAVATWYMSYPGTVIEFEAAVTKSLFNVFFHCQNGAWGRENYMLQLNTEGETNRTVKFAKYINDYMLFSKDPAVEYLPAKHKYRLVVSKNGADTLAELYILENEGPRSHIAEDKGGSFNYYDGNGSPVSAANKVEIPMDKPYLKCAKDAPSDADEPVYTTGQIGFAFSCSSVFEDSESTLYSFKVYTPLSAVKA
jgi:hypothetical protein